jgi:putative hydrolase of the HAD superfamily
MFASGDDGRSAILIGVNSVVMWDFDGTLAMRAGLWSACLLEVLDEHAPGHNGTREQLRADLKSGFPWHRATEAHPELSDPEAWWASLDPLLSRALAGAGIDEARHPELARAMRARFIDGTRIWTVFEDSRPALETTAAAGWRNVILSNHVPELPRLVATLGLDDLVEHVFSSATIGFDKPHPEAFRHALRESGSPERAWMVGDNPVADVEGAQALGIPALLIRTEGGEPDALAAAARITGA